MKVTHTDLLVAIVARTLATHARLNASWTPEGIVPHDDVNIALAIGVENAVVTAVIPAGRSCERLPTSRCAGAI